jgi:N-formylglutamate deformylase
MTPVIVQQGGGPIILGQPHGGTFLPAEIMARLNDQGRALTDTDWHINRLYDGLLPEVTVVQATFHRYVIDANRDPGGVSLYPGQNTTGLCPVTDFDGLPIWDGPPDAAEIEARRQMFHAPYHAALAAEVARVKALHGVAIVYDCHSIRSHIPFLFSGRLPLFNVGTNDGATCANAVADAVFAPCFATFDTVLNGRFKGGWTTRHYGKPAQDVHAIQMEIARRGYLDTESAPWDYAPAKADALRETLSLCLYNLDRLARSGNLDQGARNA